MELTFVYIVPLILNILLAVFLRTCCKTEDDGPISRFYCLILLISAFVPLLSWVVLAVAIGFTAGAFGAEVYVLKENRFTDYWFRK